MAETFFLEEIEPSFKVPKGTPSKLYLVEETDAKMILARLEELSGVRWSSSGAFDRDAGEFGSQELAGCLRRIRSVASSLATPAAHAKAWAALCSAAKETEFLVDPAEAHQAAKERLMARWSAAPEEATLFAKLSTEWRVALGQGRGAGGTFASILRLPGGLGAEGAEVVERLFEGLGCRVDVSMEVSPLLAEPGISVEKVLAVARFGAGLEHLDPDGAEAKAALAKIKVDIVGADGFGRLFERAAEAAGWMSGGWEDAAAVGRRMLEAAQIFEASAPGRKSGAPRV